MEFWLNITKYNFNRHIKNSLSMRMGAWDIYGFAHIDIKSDTTKDTENERDRKQLIYVKRERGSKKTQKCESLEGVIEPMAGEG